MKITKIISDLRDAIVDLKKVVLDHASTTFQLKIKEAFHIRREQLSLNQQLHNLQLLHGRLMML